jgi:UDP-glucose 4-epimerase
MSKQKKIIITGINGFIGGAIAKELQTQAVIHGLDTGAVCCVPGITQYSQMILPHSDFELLVKSFEPDYCIHCAGSASVPLSVVHPSIDFDAGPVTTFHVVEAIRKSGVQCCTIFLSSASVYGNVLQQPISEDASLKPISPYGYHKIMSEQILEEFHAIYGLPYIILRLFSAYGNGLRRQLLWDACQRLSKKDSVFWGTGDETRDFIHVNDIARLIALLIEQHVANKILNVGSGEQVLIKRVVSTIAGYLGFDVSKITFKGITREGDPLRWEADVTRIREIGFRQSIPLEEGIGQYVEWFKHLPKE